MKEFTSYPLALLYSIAITFILFMKPLPFRDSRPFGLIVGSVFSHFCHWLVLHQPNKEIRVPLNITIQRPRFFLSVKFSVFDTTDFDFLFCALLYLYRPA